MQDAQKEAFFAEAPALLLYGLVQLPGQRVGGFQRRPTLPPLIKGQLQDGPASFLEIDVNSSVYWPLRVENHSSFAALDSDRLRTILVTEGFLSRNARWRAPTVAETQASFLAGVAPGTKIMTDQQRDH